MNSVEKQNRLSWWEEFRSSQFSLESCSLVVKGTTRLLVKFVIIFFNLFFLTKLWNDTVWYCEHFKVTKFCQSMISDPNQNDGTCLYLSCLENPGSWKLPFWARIQNHFKLPKITSKRRRDAFKREAVLESPLCWQVFINSHHTATPKKWLDLHCSSASVFIYSKICDYKILLASNALQPFFKKGIKEYAR